MLASLALGEASCHAKGIQKELLKMWDTDCFELKAI